MVVKLKLKLPESLSDEAVKQYFFNHIATRETMTRVVVSSKCQKKDKQSDKSSLAQTPPQNANSSKNWDTCQSRCNNDDNSRSKRQKRDKQSDKSSMTQRYIGRPQRTLVYFPVFLPSSHHPACPPVFKPFFFGFSNCFSLCFFKNWSCFQHFLYLLIQTHTMVFAL